MINEPKKIYLQVGPENNEEIDFKDLDEVTWSADRVEESDIKYINELEFIPLIDALESIKYKCFKKMPEVYMLIDQLLSKK
ncbi:MAG TPA: hypothetical protein VK541_03985 [Pedobacter sp.]|uniref:hypothetical protein n=1 Tax=Pedobacter sp. TaxID=1411316 RepID=UPI002BEC9F20|nr:hypothetical protein [Pedobacter sp.]HMI01614.1 hypothetical protein [Pedobacter sp.]